MTPETPFTDWLEGLSAGDSQSARLLWEKYFHRMVALARKKLAGQSFPLGGAEDAAISALKSFCRGVDQGRFANLTSENSLWSLLATITARKVIRLRQKSLAKDTEPLLEGEAQLIDGEPSAEELVAFTDTVERLFAALNDSELAEVATLRMQELSVKEIAAKLGKTERRVKYKLELVRRIWRSELDQ